MPRDGLTTMSFAGKLRHLLGQSLRAQLLAWLIAPLAALGGYSVWRDYEIGRDTATLVTDRLLAAAAAEIAEQIHEEDGRFVADIPPSSLGLFASPARDRAVYQVLDPSGVLIAGYPDVARPPTAPKIDAPVVYGGAFQGAEVRLLAMAAPIATAGGERQATVIVGETLREQAHMTRELWSGDAIEQALMVALACGLALFGLNRGLRPLLALRDHVQRNGLEPQSPFAPDAVQGELRPLVESFNEAARQVKAQAEARRRFVDDAAHQLRTPLALLKTQANVGLRASSIAAKDEALQAIDRSLDSLARLANQLMALARSDNEATPMRLAEVDLGAAVRPALDARAVRALDRGVELGFETASSVIAGDETWLAELAANLVDNAIAYAGPQGRVAVSVSSEGEFVRLAVEDTGPGIPPAERERVFQRFYRAPGAQAQGSGLGLAIAKQIAEAHRASIRIVDGANGVGARIEVDFPAPPGRASLPAPRTRATAEA